jgi:hypothetical protein
MKISKIPPSGLRSVDLLQTTTEFQFCFVDEVRFRCPVTDEVRERERRALADSS